MTEAEYVLHKPIKLGTDKSSAGLFVLEISKNPKTANAQLQKVID